MPLLQLQLQRSVGGRFCSQNFIRSHSRSFCARFALQHRPAVCQATSNGQDGNGQSSRARGFGSSSDNQQKQQKAQVNNTTDALLRSLGEVSSSSGRDSGSRNMVLGSNESEEKWRQLDEKVNRYPGRRDFKAIGSGGEDFKRTIVRAVEDIVGPVKEDRILERPSSRGNFVSITLRDIKVQNPDQVLAVYAAMRRDKRLRYYL